MRLQIWLILVLLGGLLGCEEVTTKSTTPVASDDDNLPAAPISVLEEYPSVPEDTVDGLTLKIELIKGVFKPEESVLSRLLSRTIQIHLLLCLLQF